MYNTRQIVCIGRNYAKHAKELGNPLPDSLFYFFKSPSSIIGPGEDIIKPNFVQEMHNEVELGVVIKNHCPVGTIQSSSAFDSVAGYTVALDITARDLQMAAKEKGLPWSEAKSLDTFCPTLFPFTLHDQALNCGIHDEIHSDNQNNKVTLDAPIEVWSNVNGALRQFGNTSDMIFQIPEILTFLNTRIQLFPGDLILTGTPEGVGPLENGDVIEIGSSFDGKVLASGKFQVKHSL